MTIPFHIALLEPEIPPNTGNIIRLCANTGCQLHLIHPLGFQLEDKQLQRAGLDYHDLMMLQEHADFQSFLDCFSNARIFVIETCGEKNYSEVKFEWGDVFLFGSETRGLSTEVVNQFPPGQILKIPMRKNMRSLNLSNSVAVVVYEAWRQQGFCSPAVL